MKKSIKKPSVTVGIPALNEKENLKRIISEILSQSAKDYKLDQIIIISDGSTDGTEALVGQFVNRPVNFVFDETRKGKPARINQIFRLANSDVVVILDADIYLANDKVISNLIKSIDFRASYVVSGKSQPFEPENFSQGIGYAGVRIWQIVTSGKEVSDIYRVEGAIRGFTKKVYKNMFFPNTSADDAFSYIYSVTKGWKVVFNNNALINYKLPSSLCDFFRQQIRYLSSPRVQDVVFGSDVSRPFFDVSVGDKIRAVLICLYRDPIHTIFYCVIIFMVKISLLFGLEDLNSRWYVLKSTK
jgi:glycosyltransferase involved in cell wall biosynthesis